MTRSTPVRALPLLGVLALLVVSLTGCLKIDADLSIDGDVLNGTLLTALNQDAAAQLELDPAEVFATENDELTTLPGVSAEPYDDGTWAGTALTFDQVSIEQLNQLSEGDPDGLRIIRDGGAGTYQLSLVLDFSFLSELAEEEPAPGVDPAALLESFDVTVAVTFPGAVTEHNGQLSGTTVTWSPEPGERAELRAVAMGFEGTGDQPVPDPTGAPTGAGDASADPDQPGELAADRAAGESGSPAWPLVLAGGLLALAAAAAAGWWFYFRPGRNPQPGSGPDGNQPAAPDV
jgi:hypothetical protein